MSRKVKLLILMLSIPIIYIIYALNSSKSINYLSLGDDIALGINSFGISNYSYSDYFRDHLEEKNTLHEYLNNYSEKNKNITELYNDLLTNKKIIVDKKVYNLKKTLRESGIMTLSIGQNDIKNEVNSLEKAVITQTDYTNIVNKIYKKYEILLEEINKYFKGDLYILSTYYTNKEEKEISTLLNAKIKNYCKNHNINFLNIEFIGENNYLDNRNSSLPNDNAYHIIGKKLIKMWDENQIK
ncbi:MAG: hypothetical protein J6B89_03860 [Bacilli bacterium]|nr:hypothetical protein [Bacilli bacterium]